MQIQASSADEMRKSMHKILNEQADLDDVMDEADAVDAADLIDDDAEGTGVHGGGEASERRLHDT